MSGLSVSRLMSWPTRCLIFGWVPGRWSSMSPRRRPGAERAERAEARIEELVEQVAVLLRMLFGRSSEKIRYRRQRR